MFDIKPIAFYLPQFYATPYNDEWWGEGYTEWVAAKAANPLFKEHYQPQLPNPNDSYLNEYNQTELDTLEAQIKLAKAYGVHGFCHYYYWFGGRRVLEKPTDLMLANSSLDMPFCLCWANENWSRRWDGQESNILIAQDYNPETYEDFAKDLAPYFSDTRYITANGKALFLIYRPDEVPDLPKLVKVIKAQAKLCGHDGAMVLGAETFITPGRQEDPRPKGLDGAVEFPPHGLKTGMYYLRDLHNERESRITNRRKRKAAMTFEGHVFDAFEAYTQSLERPVPDYPLFRSAFPAWDNTARRGTSATVFAGSSPELFSHWVRAISDWTRKYGSSSAPFIFINAWNEWAEGAHLEPDHVYGTDYLTALREGLNSTVSLSHPFNWDKNERRDVWIYREKTRPILGCEAGLKDVAQRMKKAGLYATTTPPYWLDLPDLSYLADPRRGPNMGPLPNAQKFKYLRASLRRAQNWKEVKTALWQAFNHAHPQTPFEKFTTWVFRVVLNKG